MTHTTKTLEHQKIRLKRSLFAVLGGGIHGLVCFGLWLLGYFHTSLLGFISLFLILFTGHFFFPLLFILGINRRFKDHSLTLPQIVWSQLSVMITLFFTIKLRTVLLLFSLLSLAFGSFRLNTKQFIGIWLSTIIMFIIVVFLQLYFMPKLVNPSDELIIGFTFALVSLSFVIVAADLSEVRELLQKKKTELEKSLVSEHSDAMTDTLTGIGNRRYIMEILNKQLAIVERQPDYCFSIAVIDLDHFKKINDLYGHISGDEVLYKITQTIQAQLRKTDFLGRYGGDEFLLISTFTKRSEMKYITNRLLKAIQQLTFPHLSSDLKITLSLGATDYQSNDTATTLLKRADEALFLAKKKGRNQVDEL